MVRVAIIAALAQTTIPPSPNVMVRVRPTVCLEPCQAEASIIIEAPVGSDVCLLLDNGEYWRKSCWFHNGYRVTSVTYRGLPAGEYQVIGAILVAGKTHQSSVALRVASNKGI